MARITTYEPPSSPLTDFQFLGVEGGTTTRLATLVQVLEYLMAGATYTNQTVTLSAGQAAGTTAVLAANTSRKALMINPASDCTMSFASGDTTGWPLYAGVGNSWAMGECPKNDIFLHGLSTSAVVEIREGS